MTPLGINRASLLVAYGSREDRKNSEETDDKP